MRTLWHLSAGLIGWAVAFCLVYAVHGIGCARGWAAYGGAGVSLQRATLLVIWVAALLATLLVARHRSRRRSEPLDHVAAATAWIGFVATAITFLPIVVVPECL